MNASGMKPSLATMLQGLVVLLGLGALAVLLIEPHFEGRNAHATMFEVYFKDPFLAYVYVGSIPFFIALYRAFRLLGHVRQTGSLSPLAPDTLRTIKRSALALLGFIAGAAVLILLLGDGEDRPAGIAMCLLAASGAGVIAFAAEKFARALQN